MQAILSTYETMLASKSGMMQDDMNAAPGVTDKHVEIVKELFSGFCWRVQRGSKCKAVPDGSVPLEVWMMFLWPNYRYSLGGLGVGHLGARILSVQELFEATTHAPPEAVSLRAPRCVHIVKRFWFAR